MTDTRFDALPTRPGAVAKIGPAAAFLRQYSHGVVRPATTSGYLALQTQFDGLQVCNFFGGVAGMYFFLTDQSESFHMPVLRITIGDV